MEGEGEEVKGVRERGGGMWQTRVCTPERQRVRGRKRRSREKRVREKRQRERARRG